MIPVSTGPMPGPWTIHAYDYGYYTGGPTNLGLTLDKASGKNGDVVHLKVKRKKGALASVQVVITSKLGNRTNQATLIVGR